LLKLPLERQTRGGTMTKEKTKQELLKHYEQRKPKPFIQFDGFDPPEDAPSDAGPRIVHTETWELICSANVRVIISPRTDRGKVLEILNHLIAPRVRRDHNQLVWEMHYNDQITLFECGGLARYRDEYYLINSKADLEVLERLREEDLDCPF
jgi:hypothetical protein